MNRLHLGIKVAAARLSHRRVPFFVQLVPTSRCNLNCRYCFGEFHEREGDHFPLEKIEKVIDGLAELGTRFILLTGGEPMMHPRIADIVGRIGSHGIELLLGSNGLTIAERIDELEPVDTFSISLDGSRKHHDYYRGNGSYDIAMSAIRAARDHKKRVQLQFTMTRDLIDSFEDVNKTATELGCFIGINFLRPQRQAGGSVVNPDEATNQEIEEFIQYLIKTRPRTLPYPVSLLKKVSNWPYDYGRDVIYRREDLKGYKPITCSAGKLMMAIDNRGDIYPCAKWLYTRPLGNCLDGNIKKAWQELAEVNCVACLDLGFNLLNDTLHFSPGSLLGLLRSFRRG
ncbi:MAG: radical SAM protein [Candidatus Auribacterota bacterium]|nr:radical SAM protein [Candidatus Auribacterota bacterium]